MRKSMAKSSKRSTRKRSTRKRGGAAGSVSPFADASGAQPKQ
jgi:hypothetical protein